VGVHSELLSAMSKPLRDACAGYLEIRSDRFVLFTEDEPPHEVALPSTQWAIRAWSGLQYGITAFP